VKGDVDQVEAITYDTTGYRDFSFTTDVGEYTKRYYFLDGYSPDDVSDFCFKFRAKGANNVLVGLFYDTASPTNELYEILIGGWGDTKSCVRKGNQGQCHHSPNNDDEGYGDLGTAYDSQGWLDSTEFKHFWVSYFQDEWNAYIWAGEGFECGENVITEHTFSYCMQDCDTYELEEPLAGSVQSIGFSSWNSEVSYKSVADLDNDGIEDAVSDWNADPSDTEFNLGHISAWTTSRVTNMNKLFYDYIQFNEDLSAWDTSGVTRMIGMFMFASSFNGDISGWDTSRVVNMRYMFMYASSFNGDISGWDTSNVRIMRYMFYGACEFSESYTDNWDMTGASTFQMFGGCE